MEINQGDEVWLQIRQLSSQKSDIIDFTNELPTATYAPDIIDERIQPLKTSLLKTGTCICREIRHIE